RGSKKIMVFGTFDGLHKGHFDFFKQARKLAVEPFLIVSVARDKNVLKIKGERPILSEKERINLIKKNGLADKVILAGVQNHIPHILKEKPDVIALGYDQSAYVENLKEDLRKSGLVVKIVRLKPYKEHIYKNHLLKKKRLL
ncbi:MAG: adenylyltransferase/cytidyltransferase family protein, partial [Patescibacteria group bacterium]